jgi:hypothetical protein
MFQRCRFLVMVPLPQPADCLQDLRRLVRRTIRLELIFGALPTEWNASSPRGGKGGVSSFATHSANDHPRHAVPGDHCEELPFMLRHFYTYLLALPRYPTVPWGCSCGSSSRPNDRPISVIRARMFQ